MCGAMSVVAVIATVVASSLNTSLESLTIIGQMFLVLFCIAGLAAVLVGIRQGFRRMRGRKRHDKGNSRGTGLRIAKSRDRHGRMDALSFRRMVLGLNKLVRTGPHLLTALASVLLTAGKMVADAMKALVQSGPTGRNEKDGDSPRMEFPVVPAILSSR